MSGGGGGIFNFLEELWIFSAMTQCSFLQIVYVQNIHEMFIFTIEFFIFIQVVKGENAGIDSAWTKWCLMKRMVHWFK